MRPYPEERLPASYYEASTDRDPDITTLPEPRRCDVAIIGGGFTGLAAALTLAQAGKRVFVFEARRIGWGASGRNGGLVLTGMRRDQEYLERVLGLDMARQYWRLAVEAKRHFHELIARHEIACDLRPGVLSVIHKPRLVADYRRHVDHMQRSYDYQALEWLDAREANQRTGCEHFFGGYADRDACHIHPLKFALGLAKAARLAGAFIVENCRVDHYSRDDRGRITLSIGSSQMQADHLLLCANGYFDEIEPRIGSHVLSINNFMIATEPLSPPDFARILPNHEGAADSRFVVNFWRKSADNRLIFGGGENYSAHWPRDIAGFVRHYMLKLYPFLRETRIDYAWGGTLAITRARMPFLRALAPNILCAAGYSGQGVMLAPFIGHVMAKAANGIIDDFDILSRFPSRPFPGGGLLRWPLQVAGLSWHALLDRL